jgi:hypothetical protein
MRLIKVAAVAEGFVPKQRLGWVRATAHLLNELPHWRDSASQPISRRWAKEI